MRVVSNTSAYQTRDVLAIVRRAVKPHVPPDLYRRLRVRLTPARTRTVGGRAACPGLWMRLSLPSPHPVLGIVPRLREQLAATAIHEAWHTKGVSAHGDMPAHVRYGLPDRVMDGVAEPAYPWAVTMPLRIKLPPRRKTKEDRANAKLAAARRKVAEWERKSKLAATKLKLWRRRMARLESREKGTGHE